MTTRLTVAWSFLAVLLAAASAGASGPAASAGANGRAYAIRVVVPGQTEDVRASVSAPPPTAAFGASYAYPTDNPVVTTGSMTASASADVGANATANASSQVNSVSLFGGEITAASVSGRVRGSTNGRTATGNVAASTVSGLVVLGQPVSSNANGRVALADWGYAVVLGQTSIPGTASGAQTWRGFVTGLDIHLTAPHGGLPAGTEVQLGYAEATVQGTTAPPRPVTPPTTRPAGPKATHVKKPKARIKPPEPKQTKLGVSPAPKFNIPYGVHPALTAGGYVFPVYGPSSFTDTFGMPRADTGWHHGGDIFAPLGAPVLAVANGTVFSVGWNDLGGNRLWLQDGQGNQFYYAHLSAFSPLAKNGSEVRAGEVIGFVGNTGDAEGTPFHLHFEIHPVSRLYLGYDGAVDPTGYLVAWKRLRDVRFDPAASWVAGFASSSPAPKPGAILLQMSDISEASGLDPGSLRRAFVAPVAAEGDGALLRAAGASSD